MANIFRGVGLAAVCAGLIFIAMALMPPAEGNTFALLGSSLVTQAIFIAMALMPPAEGNTFALLGSSLVTQAIAAITAGIVALGFGQLIAVNQRVAENMASLLAHIRNEDGEDAQEPQSAPARNAFGHVPSYDPRRDPPVVKEGTYRDYTVLTLRDGTIAIETQAGWKRFRTIQDFDRLLRA